ncbi:MAG: helicase C-terminal domain-containing protein [Nanoarchaeota archaeon]
MSETWSLYEEKDGVERLLPPLMFSNGKTQEDVVKEIIKAIEEGNKLIFLRGMCGTGKSAIALNLAKAFGRASIVVPVKNLQKQYEEDYSKNKYIKKDNGERLKISTIKGRQNFECRYIAESGKKFDELITKKSTYENNNYTSNKEANRNVFSFTSGIKVDKEKRSTEAIPDDKSADNDFIPCKIEIKEKNGGIIREYVKEAERISLDRIRKISQVRRGSVAPACPYWSPIAPSEKDLGLNGIKRDYMGLNNIKYSYYERKPGCKYYEQFKAYLDADVIIFNSQKYRVESLLNRKPATNIEIIDECDEFLDSFSNTKKINLGWLSSALERLFFEDPKAERIVKEINMLIRNIYEDKGINSQIIREEIMHIKDTPIIQLVKYFLETDFLEKADYDEENYAYDCEETALTFDNFLDETYVSFEKEGNNISVKLVTINLEKRFREELLDKNKVVVLMSGTIHSEKVLKDVFGLDQFKVVDAETAVSGTITKKRTGMEFNCRYENFKSGGVSREHYLKVLDECVKQSVKPTLVHVNSFADLPTEEERNNQGLELMSQENLRSIQDDDSEGALVAEFKSGKTKILYSTKCNRGVDFPGETCNSIIITKYPYPNVDSLFWKIFRKVKPEQYNEFYIDKAKREFLQRLYRGLRRKDDHIYLMSPDVRIFYGV